MVDSRLFRLDFAGGFPVAFGSFLEFIDCLRIKGIGHSLPGTLPGRPVFTLVIHLNISKKIAPFAKYPPPCPQFSSPSESKLPWTVRAESNF